MVVKIISKGNSIVEKPITPNVGKIKVVKKEPTQKQKNVIKIVKESMGVKGGKSKASILREAGYSEKVAGNPDRVFDSPVITQAINPVVGKMRDIRTKVLDALQQKEMTKQSAYNLVLISSILTKDSELLDGRPTDRTEYELPAEEKARLDKILKMNS